MNISDHELSEIALTTSATDTSFPAVRIEPETPRADGSLEEDQGPRRGAISDRELTFVLVSSDFLCAYIALPVSLLLFSQISAASLNSMTRLGDKFALDSLFPISVVVALALGGMYRSTNRRLQPSAFMEIRDLSFGVGAGCVLALAVGAFLHFSLKITEPIATQLVFAVIVTIIAITFGRLLLRFFLYALTTTRVLVVGSGKLTERIMMNVKQDPGMTLVGRVVDGDVVEDGADGRVRDLPILCPQLGVHRVLVAFPDEVSDESLSVYRRLQDSVHIAMVPRYFELVSWRSRMSDLSGTPFLEFARPHLSSWDGFMKRAFDITVSSLVLLLTSPLLLAVAIGVKLSSPGPVFFHQTRMGRHQRPFTITKFRSMTTAAETEEGEKREGERRGRDSSTSIGHSTNFEENWMKGIGSRVSVRSCVRPASTRSRNSSTCSGATCRSSDHDLSSPPSQVSTAGVRGDSTCAPGSPASGRFRGETISPARTFSSSTTSTSPHGRCGGISRSCGRRQRRWPKAPEHTERQTNVYQGWTRSVSSLFLRPGSGPADPGVTQSPQTSTSNLNGRFTCQPRFTWHIA